MFSTRKTKRELEKFFNNGYYIILVENNSYKNKLYNFLKYKKWSKYDTVLINVSSNKFIEANQIGEKLITIKDLNNCNSICLLEPKGMSNKYWTKCINQIIKPYKNLYSASKNKYLSIFEILTEGFRECSDYSKNFSQFDRIVESKKIVPSELKKCIDLYTVYED